MLRDHIEPVIGSDPRYTGSSPRIAPANPDRRFLPRHLRVLTDAQLADYRLLKSKGYSKTEALAAVQKPKVKAVPAPPSPRDFWRLEDLTRQRTADRTALVQSGQPVVAELIVAADQQANGARPC